MSYNELYRTETMPHWVNDICKLPKENKDVELVIIKYNPTNYTLCRKCNVIKENDEFYYGSGKLMRPCKQCKRTSQKKNFEKNKKKNNYIKKRLGFAALSDEIRKGVIDDLPLMNCKEIADKYNINAQNLRLWKNKNQIIF